MMRHTASAAMAILVLAGIPLAASADCTMQYQRADNMWAGEGNPVGNLGIERITLRQNENKRFNTDWRYEKQRNDGVQYYGSHLRIARVLSGRVKLGVRTSPATTETRDLYTANVDYVFKGDLERALCQS